MWKKSNEEFSEPLSVPPLQGDFSTGGNEQAVIGSSITIKGDLTGEEDLVIQGKVEGTIRLNQYNVTVGKNGRIKADIYAKGIKIDGEVDGNLYGEEQVVIRKTGHVRGNIKAPKVGMEEGCRFKGSVEMDAVPAKKETKSVQKDQSLLPATTPAKEKGKVEVAPEKVKPVF